MKTLRILLTIGLMTSGTIFSAPAQQTAQQPASAQAFYNVGRQAFVDGDLPKAQQMFTQALKLDPQHAPSIAMLDRVKAAMPKGDAQVRSLNSLIIESVEFDNATFESVLEYLRQQAVKQSGGNLQPNFVLKADDPKELGSRRISLRLKGVPFLEVLRYACDQASAEYKIERYAIVVSPLQRAGSSAPQPLPTAQ